MEFVQRIRVTMSGDDISFATEISVAPAPQPPEDSLSEAQGSYSKPEIIGTQSLWITSSSPGNQGRKGSRVAGSIPITNILSPKARQEYVATVVLPEIQRAAEIEELDGRDLLRLEKLVQERGEEVLLPEVRLLSERTLTTTSSRGLLGFAHLPITGDFALRHFVKRHPSKGEYQESRSIDEVLTKHAEELGIADLIPPLLFHSDKDQVTIFPQLQVRNLDNLIAQKIKALSATDMVTAAAIQRFEDRSTAPTRDARRLYEVLAGSETPEQRVGILRNVIEAYVDLHKGLNSERGREVFNFPKRLSDFTEYFAKTYSDNSSLVAAFDRHIGSALNLVPRSNIHGDLHTRNVLEGPTFIDWGAASSDGFAQFDLRKLLMKVNISMDQEYSLVNYAAELFHPNDLEKQGNFLDVYIKNKVLQELVAAKKYGAAAHGAKREKDTARLFAMADILYTDATSRLEDAVQRGIVDQEFYSLIVQAPPSFGDRELRRLSAGEYASFEEKSSPKKAQTQQNFAPTSVLLPEESQSAADVVARVSLTLKRRRKKSLLERIVAGAVGLGLLAALPFGIDAYSEYQVELAEQERVAEEYLNIVEERTLTTYRGYFSKPFDQLLRAKSRGEEAHPVIINSTEVQEVAERYGLDFQILKKMMEINKVIGGMHVHGRDDLQVEDNYLDPIRANFTCTNSVDNCFLSAQNLARCYADPRDNLYKGAELLSKLLEEHQGDLEHALWDFYSPTTSALSQTEIQENPRSTARTETLMKDIIYSITNSYSVGYCSDFNNQFIHKCSAPEDYLADFHLVPQ